MRNPNPFIFGVMCLVFSSGVSMNAFAESSDPNVLQKAKQLFEQGQTAYRVGEFANALEHFKSALKLVERSSTIFNVAQCHRQLKHHEEALFYYKLHLSRWAEEHPDQESPHLKEVEGHIQTLTHTIEQQKAQARVAEEEKLRREQEAQRIADEIKRTQLAKEQADAERRLALALIEKQAAQARQNEAPFYKRWWFWSAIGAAVVGGTVAALAAQPRTEDPLTGTFPTGQVKLP